MPKFIGCLSLLFLNRLLQIQRLNLLGRHEDAMKGLDSMIERDPTNSVPYKRKIAILKSLGKTTEAIKELSEYLNRYKSLRENQCFMKAN